MDIPTFQRLRHWQPSRAFAMSLYWCILAFVFARLLQHILNPPHRRKAPTGKPWKLPPGPRGWPIVGSFFEVQSTKACLELGKYGEMATVQVGSRTWVVINSSRVAQELFVRRGAITKERSHLPIAGELISRNQRLLWMNFNDWNPKRKVIHQLLTGTAITKYGEYQEIESTQLLAEYLLRPKQWYLHNFRFASSVINWITLGERVLQPSKTLLAVLRVVHAFVTYAPPASLIDVLPQLAYLPKPLQWWRKKFETIGEETDRAFEDYWLPIRQKIDEGTASPSFARDVLNSKDTTWKGSEKEKMFIAVQLIEAGSDTTRMNINIFVMAMLCYPEVLKRAQHELDSVCGTENIRLPVLADEKSMPYICALIKELLRWRPIFPWTPDHVSTEIIEFEGYRFPQGTSFMINHLSIYQNPNEHKDPEKFLPERWLDGHESDIIHGLWSFGGGRRVCVGYRLAQKSLFIAISCLAYCFNFTSPGPVDNTVLNHHTLEKAPFPVTVSVRSQKHAYLIEREAKETDVWEVAGKDPHWFGDSS